MVHLRSHCGADFDAYVHKFQQEFVVSESDDSTSTEQYISCNLWQGRRFRLLLSRDSPLWHIGKVTKLEYLKKENSELVVDWFLTMEFETKKKQRKEDISEEPQLRLGDYVELKDLVAASKYNGAYGVIVSGDNFTKMGRYGVQVRERLDDEQEDGIHRTGKGLKHLSILPKNISKFQTLEKDNDDDISDNDDDTTTKIEWTWKICRLHPTTGGTLEGTIRDCATLLSFEWLGDPQPPSLSLLTDLSKEESVRECRQWVGTSGYFLSTDGMQKYRNRWSPAVNDDGWQVNVFRKYSFIEIRGNGCNTSIKKFPIVSIPRSKTIPTVSKRMYPNRKCKGVDEVWILSAFNRLAVEGQFTAEWESDDTSYNSQRTLIIAFYIDDTGPEAAIPLRKRKEITSFVFKYNEEKFDFEGGSILFNYSFEKFLTQVQQGYFPTRLAHWFFRQENAIVQLQRKDVLLLLKKLFQFYTSTEINRPKEALDIAVMEADYCYSNMVDDDAVENPRFIDIVFEQACQRIGETLMLLGRCREAAEFFSESADYCIPHKHNVLYEVSGAAFDQLNDFETAEQQYIKAMSHCDEDLVAMCKGVFSLMISSYEHTVHVGSPTVSSEEAEDMFVTFSALLYAAGLESHTQSIVSECVQQFGRKRPSVLKKKFLSRSKAVKRVRDASKSSNVQDFRASILFCRDPNCVITLVAAAEPPVKLPGIKHMGKKLVQDHNNSVQPLHLPCSECKKNCCERKQCPCEMVSYCSKDCQIAHWKIHKKDCTHRKPKSRK